MASTPGMYGGYDPAGAAGGMPGMGMMGPGGMGPMPPTAFIPTQHDFANVAHALWAILLAASGGVLASWLYSTRPKAADAEAVAGRIQ
jgi:hypothetical protein